MKGAQRKPRRFGGMGGIWGGRPLNETDLFEVAAARALGDRVRGENDAARELWGALANVTWAHRAGDTAGYSFRAAGDLVAAIVGHGADYLDYYCQSAWPKIPDWIASAMAQEGWTGTPCALWGGADVAAEGE